jgi:hypothetical protein
MLTNSAKNNMKKIYVPLILALFAGASQAATITWSLPQNIVGASDVSTAGTLFGTWLAGGSGGTVNGVAFVGNSLDFTTTLGNSFGGFAPATSDATYNSLLANGLFTDNTSQASFTLNTFGLKPLVLNNTYQIQIWVTDPRPLAADRTQTISGSSAIDFHDATTTLGQYIIGTFTADAANQVFNITPSAASQLNLVQVRTIPEPSAFAMLLGGLGLLGFRRRRA